MKVNKKYLLPSLAVLAAAAITGCDAKNEAVDQKEVDLTKIDIMEQPAKPAATAVDPSTVRVTVNGTDITAGQIMQMANRQLQMMAQQMPPEQLQAIQGQIMAQIEDGLIMEQVILDAAKNAGFSTTDEEVQKFIDENIKPQLPPEMSLEQMISQQGLDMAKFTAQMKNNLTIQKFMEAEAAKIEAATDAEAKKFYDENPSQFESPEQVRASHILVKVDPGATAEADAAAKLKAEGLAKQAKDGADFAELAKANSDCPSGQTGGDLNFFTKERMVPEFSDAAFAMDVNEISDVVKTQFGYHVIKVTEKKAPETVKLETVNENLKNHLTQQKQAAAMQSLTEDLRSKADIKYPTENK